MCRQIPQCQHLQKQWWAVRLHSTAFHARLRRNRGTGSGARCRLPAVGPAIFRNKKIRITEFPCYRIFRVTALQLFRVTEFPCYRIFVQVKLKLNLKLGPTNVQGMPGTPKVWGYPAYFVGTRHTLNVRKQLERSSTALHVRQQLSG